MVLDVDDDGDAEKKAAAEAGVPPVEERHLMQPFFGVIVVELIGSEALKRGLVAAGAYRDAVDREEEEDLVNPPWLGAGRGGVTRPQSRDYSRHCQDKQALF